RRLDDVGWRGPLALRADAARFDAGHVQDLLEQPVQSLELAHGEPGLLLALWLRQRRVQDVAQGHADSRERSAEIVTERTEQCRRQLGTLARELCLTALLEELRALDRDCRDAGDGVERAGLEIASADCQETTRLHTESNRHERQRRARGQRNAP